MTERRKPEPLDRLDERLRRLRAQEEGRRRSAAGVGAAGSRGGLGLALRIGVELVAALVVGGGIGLLLDRWLGSGPWLMVAFFVLGAAAGMLNVYRAMSGMSQAVGYAGERREHDRDGGRHG